MLPSRLATARVLLGYKADPCCHVPTALEDGGIGVAGDERAGEQRARDLHQAATYLSLPRACPDATIVLKDLLLHNSQLCGEHLQADTRIGRNAQILAISDNSHQALTAAVPACSARTVARGSRIGRKVRFPASAGVNLEPAQRSPGYARRRRHTAPRAARRFSPCIIIRLKGSEWRVRNWPKAE